MWLTTSTGDMEEDPGSMVTSSPSHFMGCGLELCSGPSPVLYHHNFVSVHGFSAALFPGDCFNIT